MILYNKQINVDDAARGRRRHLFSMTSSSEYALSSSKHGIIGVSVDRFDGGRGCGWPDCAELQIVERGETALPPGAYPRRPASAGRARRCTAQRDTVTVRRTAERDAAAVRLHVPLRKRRRWWRRRARC